MRSRRRFGITDFQEVADADAAGGGCQRRVPTRDRYEWAADHLESEVADIDVVEIPNRAAVRILMTAIETPEGMERFWVKHKAVTAGETASEVLARFEDDGRNLDGFMAKVDAIFAAEVAAG